MPPSSLSSSSLLICLLPPYLLPVPLSAPSVSYFYQKCAGFRDHHHRHHPLADLFPGKHGLRAKRMTSRYWKHIIWLACWCVWVSMKVHVCLTWRHCWWPLIRVSAPPWRGQKTSSRQHNTGTTRRTSKDTSTCETHHNLPWLLYKETGLTANTKTLMSTEEIHCGQWLENTQPHRYNTDADIKMCSAHVWPATWHVVDAFIQNSLRCNACIFSAQGLSGNKIKGWKM